MIRPFDIKKIKNFIRNKVGSNSNKIYSQGGEDIILAEAIGEKKIGFYIDIGAHHPSRFSNTYMFYKRGWNGINIDPLPGSMKIFDKKRPRDINLEIAISGQRETKTYYMFRESALNTFSKEVAECREKETNYRVIEQRKIKTFPLVEVLDKHIEKYCKIDFMNVDVEGLDLDVLKSNDWEKYPVEYLLVESLNLILEDVKKDPTYMYLKNQGYKLIAKTLRTYIFKKS